MAVWSEDIRSDGGAARTSLRRFILGTLQRSVHNAPSHCLSLSSRWAQAARVHRTATEACLIVRPTCVPVKTGYATDGRTGAARRLVRTHVNTHRRASQPRLHRGILLGRFSNEGESLGSAGGRVCGWVGVRPVRLNWLGQEEKCILVRGSDIRRRSCTRRLILARGAGKELRSSG